MTAWRDPDVDYSNFGPAVNFLIESAIEDIHTAMPGTVISYDATTRRAEIEPSLRHVLGDGQKSLIQPPVLDVPVLHPAGGGYVILMPIKPGDAVMMVFSERGITDFKKRLELSDPDITDSHSMRDAVAIPGFGPSGEVVPGRGIRIQSIDGKTRLSLETGSIKMIVDDQEATMSSTGLVVENLVVSGSVHLPPDVYSGGGLTPQRNIGAGHKHIYPDPGPPPSSARTGPVSP